ncbi:hypothetical protein L210DRAFT_3508558 [Boletus edulis BED1]|uniref:URB1 C-terminal domain-containing protein n=1 Tax=Boletus edulis BED1 TaxID=1328754 RepID=A0AAD4BHF8_BOLED|nr:hypothetical protein L210DRAFT_3508558 [Boletus edulis BED1]
MPTESMKRAEQQLHRERVLQPLEADLNTRIHLWLGRRDVASAINHRRLILPSCDVPTIAPRHTPTDAIHGLCVSERLAVKVHEAIRGFLAVSFNPANAEDQTLLSPIGSHWADMMTKSLSSGQFDEAVLPGSTLLEDMLLGTLVSQLPSGFDGHITFTEGQQLSTVLSRTKPTHLNDLRSLPISLTSQLFEKETWTGSTGGIIVALLYSNPPSVQAFATWLGSKRWTRLDLRLFAPVLAAFLDCVALTPGDLSEVNDDVLHALVKLLFLGEQHHLTRHLECIHKILGLSGTRRARLVSTLQERIQGIPIMDLTFETTFFARRLIGISGCGALTTSIVDRALQWAVRYLSDDITHSRDSNTALKNLSYVAIQEESLKPYLMEPSLTTLVRRHLLDASMLDLAVALTGKPHLSISISSRSAGDTVLLPRGVKLCVYSMHSSGSIPPTLVYGGTMSLPDRRILSIMRLFEGEKRTSLSIFFSRWSPSPDITVSDALEVVQNFDPVYMLRTCLAFPSWRRLGEEKGLRDGPADDSMYDPLMAIVLSVQMVVKCPPTTPLGWVKVFRSNIIANLEESVQKYDMHETPQVLYVFHLLKNVLHPPSNVGDPPRRLPTFTTLILLHALRGIFYPSNFIYPRTARFLLQRPELDVSDVPMLFGMLYSNSDDWKKERGWMLRMLGDGMASTDDWKVLKRRHTWYLVASLFQSSRNDSAVRAGILEVGDNPGKESMAWLRVLENVLVVADVSKLTRATGDQWCLTICRCVSALLGNIGNGHLAPRRRGHATTQSCLRHTRSFSPPVLSRAVESLQHLEPAIHLHQSLRRPVESDDNAPLARPPHRTQGLHDVPVSLDPLRTWGEIVEALWRAAMAPVNDDEDGTHGTWAMAMLTRRLLVWRALVGEEACPALTHR